VSRQAASQKALKRVNEMSICQVHYPVMKVQPVAVSCHGTVM